MQFDYIVSEDFPSEEINLYRYTDGSWGTFSKENKGRAIILEDVKGKTAIIGLGCLATEFDDYLLRAQKVVDTVEWRGS